MFGKVIHTNGLSNFVGLITGRPASASLGGSSSQGGLRKVVARTRPLRTLCENRMLIVTSQNLNERTTCSATNYKTKCLNNLFGHRTGQVSLGISASQGGPRKVVTRARPLLLSESKFDHDTLTNLQRALIFENKLLQALEIRISAGFYRELCISSPLLALETCIPTEVPY